MKKESKKQENKEIINNKKGKKKQNKEIKKQEHN